jgi:hypothetical protein
MAVGFTRMFASCAVESFAVTHRVVNAQAVAYIYDALSAKLEYLQ